MNNWKGFSSKEITLVSNNHDSDLKTKYAEDENLISRNHLSSPSSISLGGKKCSFKKRNDTFRKNDGKNYAVIYPIPQEAKLVQSSKIDDNESSSSLEMSLTSSSSPSSIPRSPCNQLSPSNTAPGNQSTPVTILVGEDKSYKMITSLPNDELPVKTIDLNEDSAIHPVQKAFLLEKDMEGHISLEHFQERQKLMEEQNKRKKELLSKAIADKKRQTQHEAKKIFQIQEELNRLDVLLSTDVSILRNQIEIASYEFNEAQKRYDKAESEFIEAKMQMFTKLERKELLTQHLCKIIETNEHRKAKKLSELMAKLEISDEKDNPKSIPDKIPVLPQSPSLNEVTYKACQTLKPPNNQKLATKSCDSKLLTGENAFKLNPDVSRDLDPNSATKLNSHQRSSEALQSINLITAQNLDQRNDNIPCNFDSGEET